MDKTPEGIIISSVVRGHTEAFMKALERLFTVRPFMVDYAVKTGIRLDIPNPEGLGADSARWDLARFDAEVRESQAQRRVVYEALREGAYTPWDYQPPQNAAERFMRNHMNLDTLEASKRFPRGE